MKLILTSDLHQRIEKWPMLVAAVRAEKPRFVLIAGDLLPKTTFADQKAFFKELRRLFHEMKRSGPLTALTYLGNDDAHVLEPLLDELEHEGLCINLNGRVHREAGLVFCGMNRVRDYPFGYKHWCVRDGDFIACPQQFCGEGLEMDEHGTFVPLDNLIAYLNGKPSLGDEIERLTEQLRPGEMERSVWIVHQPPSGQGMDICGDGRQVGSPTVLKFILENQPLVGCSGHIHESPYQPGGRWLAQINRTFWVQPGQVGPKLHYVCVAIDDTLSVENMRHSVLEYPRS